MILASLTGKSGRWICHCGTGSSHVHRL